MGGKPTGGVGPFFKEPVRSDRFRLALNGDRLKSLEGESAFAVEVGIFVHKDLPRLGDTREAGGEVDRVPCHADGTLLEVDLAGDDEAGGDARVEGEASADLLLVLKTDGIHDLMYLLRRPDGPKVVILVSFGDTKEGNDGIPDILFDEALITVDDLGNF
ncbi:MAG: hypothetical protein ABSD38_38725, partial [Syntrophorhabdales bacterium]